VERNAVTRRILRQYLEILVTMRPLPLTILVPRGDADCALLEALRDEIEAALPCASGACAEGVGAWTEQYLPPPPAPPPPPMPPRKGRIARR
jgi:hypothetical protein